MPEEGTTLLTEIINTVATTGVSTKLTPNLATFTSVVGGSARHTPLAAAGKPRVAADAYTDWLSNITAGWGPFARFSTLAATVVGVVMLGALIYAVINIVFGISKGGYRRGGRSEAIADGREQLQHGIVALIVIPVVPVLAAGIYLLAKNS
jgi:hypothetical protein